MSIDKLILIYNKLLEFDNHQSNIQIISLIFHYIQSTENYLYSDLRLHEKNTFLASALSPSPQPNPPSSQTCPNGHQPSSCPNSPSCPNVTSIPPTSPNPSPRPSPSTGSCSMGTLPRAQDPNSIPSSPSLSSSSYAYSTSSIRYKLIRSSPALRSTFLSSFYPHSSLFLHSSIYTLPPPSYFLLFPPSSTPSHLCESYLEVLRSFLMPLASFLLSTLLPSLSFKQSRVNID